jgi:hypothetical protein
LGKTGELSGKIENVEERLTNLQGEISNLISYLSTPHESSKGSMQRRKQLQTQKAQAPVEIRGPPVILRCKQWEDFQTLAHQAQTLSFLYKEAEKTFQVDALKNNQIITYSGELPKPTALLKTWLSKQLEFLKTRFLKAYWP